MVGVCSPPVTAQVMMTFFGMKNPVGWTRIALGRISVFDGEQGQALPPFYSEMSVFLQTASLSI